ncbi:MAG: WecB/TagA/CpsF family glycosyltransferase [Candidatus Hodarchaeales archaeon]|jgi:N-acetylglucosaminyldiphosphoundecaprenol N-acetyl-beta-D-mannosaminyltransferase
MRKYQAQMRKITKNNTEKELRKAQKYVKILEINIASTTKDKVLRFVRDSLGRNKKFLIVTPNPEQVILAQKDYDFKRILNNADYAICDTVGLSQAAKYLSLKATKVRFIRLLYIFLQGILVGASTFVNREWLESELKVIKGRELFKELIQLANKKKLKVFLLGGGEISGTAGNAAKNLASSYKGVRFKYSDGHMLDQNAKPVTSIDRKIEKKVIKEINYFKPHLLFIGFGAPKQEKWVYRWLQKLEIGGAMVVGGTFDYVAGNKKISPKWIDKMGLEWLWRILIGDQKVKRIYNAAILFPLKVFVSKLR